MRGTLNRLAVLALLAIPSAAWSQESANPAKSTRDSVANNGGPSPRIGGTEPSQRDWFGSTVGFTKWSSVSGDWAGLRTTLADRGITLEATYTHDVSLNTRGGATRGTALRGLLMAELSADLATLVHLPGATAFVSYARQRGANGSDLAGDIQAFSNIDTDPFTHLYEAWFEQSFGEKLRIKIGRVDANTEFAVVDAAGDFINASGGFSPTVLGLPTYPDPKMSANVFVQPASWLSISGGIFSGTFEPATDGTRTVSDKFSIGQASASWEKAGRFGAGTFALGAWNHTGMAERFDGGTSKGARGWWTTAEQRVSGEAATDETAAAGVRVFAKYGWAPEMTSAFQQHVMLGAVRDGGFRPGSEDALGVAMSFVDLSDVAGAGTPRNETSTELFYKIKVFGFATVRPDVQYVVHPSGDRARRSALVATLRTAITF